MVLFCLDTSLFETTLNSCRQLQPCPTTNHGMERIHSMYGPENGMTETTMMTEKANPTTTNQILTPTTNQILTPTTTTTQATTPNHGTKMRANLRKGRATTTRTGTTGNITDPPTTVATPTIALSQMTLGTNGRTQVHHQLSHSKTHATLSLKGECQLHKYQEHRNHLQLSHFQQMPIGKATSYSMDPESSRCQNHLASSICKLGNVPRWTNANSSTVTLCYYPNTRSTAKSGSTCWTDAKVNQRSRKPPGQLSPNQNQLLPTWIYRNGKTTTQLHQSATCQLDQMDLLLRKSRPEDHL